MSWNFSWCLRWRFLAFCIVAIAWLSQARSDLGEVARVDVFTRVTTTASHPAFAFGQGGQQLAVAGGTDAVTLIDLTEGTMIELKSAPSGDTATAVAFAANGRRLAAASEERIAVWDLDSQTLTTWLEGLDGEVRDLSLSAAGDLAAARIGDAQILIWDIATGESNRYGSLGDTITHIALTPDGKRLATGAASGEVLVRDMASGEVQELPAFEKGSTAASSTIAKLAFGLDGQVLVGGNQTGDVAVWDLESGASHDLPAASAARGFAVSSDGARLVTDGSDGSIRLWDLATMQEPHAIAQTVETSEILLALSQDGWRLASVDDAGAVRLHDLRVGTSSRLSLGTTGPFLGIALDSAGALVTTLAETGEVSLLRLPTGEARSVFLSDFHVGTALAEAAVRATDAGASTKSPSLGVASTDASSAQAASSLSASDPQARDSVDISAAARARQTGAVRRWMGLTSIAISQDGRRIAATEAGGAVRLWNEALAEVSAVTPVPEGSALARARATMAPATAVAFTLNDARMVTVGSDTVVRWWNPLTGAQVQRSFGPEHPIRAVAASPTENLVVAGGEDTRVMAWDSRTGRLKAIFSGQRDFVNTLAFSNDGRILASGGADGQVILWDTASGALKARLMGSASAINRVVFSPDDAFLASAGADSAIRLWNVASGRLMRSLTGHQAPVRALAFSSTKNNLLVSGGEDGRLLVWNATSGKLQTTLSAGSSPVSGLAFMPDGRLLIADESGTVTVWDAELLRKSRTLPTELAPLNVEDDSLATLSSPELGASMAQTAGFSVAPPAEPTTTQGLLRQTLSGLLNWLVPGASAATPTGINQGPGGPILVVTPLPSETSPNFGTYYAEILRTEGLNAFQVADLADNPLTTANLANYDVVVLAPGALTASQVTALSAWVTAGGNLVAMRPDAQLYSLLGIANSATSVSNGYLLVDTANAPGKGIVGQTIQFHGVADRYSSLGATTIATLYTDPTTPSVYPAVSLRTVGANGGQAAAFAFDLATSIVQTRQGNPAWATQERDGLSPIRSDDKFYGAAASDPQPDWTNLDKVGIPQADELQRLLVNLILEMNKDRKPLPRFWYFPNGKKAAVIMTGDDHANNGTEGRFNQFLAASTPGCSVEDWECIRGTSYIFPNMYLSNATAAAFEAQGFEIGLHVNTWCADFTETQLVQQYSDQIALFSTTYPSLAAPITERHHCIAWSDWVTAAKVQLSNGIRLDTSYYFWPPSWVLDRPGFFNGSGMPMRFADLDGTMIDVYNAQTQMTDESGQTYPFTVDSLLDGALGASGYYGAFTINAHTDVARTSESDAVLASAPPRGVPIVSARQMLTWLDGRNASAFSGLSWSGSSLSFGVTVGSGARGLQALLPAFSTAGILTAITRDTQSVPFTMESVKGITYARFAAAAGAYTASYGSDTTAPTVTGRSPTSGETGVAPSTTVTATFSEALDPVTVTAATFNLTAGANAVAATVSYDSGTQTATLTPTAPLGDQTLHSVTVKGGANGVKDLAGNALAADATWSFTTAQRPVGCAAGSTIWPPTQTPTSSSANDPGAVELGVKFRPSVNGFVCGVRFYKGVGNGGTHLGSLWSSSGALLAQATFTDETATGWQQVSFATPVAVTANTVYVASYHAPLGHYAFDGGYFATSGVTNGPLQALSHAESGGNGVYLYSAAGGFPSNIWNSTNYWVDVVFTTSTGPDTTAPTVTGRSPTAGATNALPSTTVTATFSEAVDPATVTAATLRLSAGGSAVAATVSYDAATRTATLTPTTPLSGSTDHSVTVTGGSAGIKDLAGNALAADVNWSFTTGEVPVGCTAGSTIWTAAQTPVVTSADDSGAVEVGVKFRPSVDGFICGLRFYKGAGNGGQHLGSLWSSTGTLLAQATFTNESATGWQQVSFASPIAVTANTVYVASYHAPLGRYAADGGYFAATGVTSGLLHALSNVESGGNGVYRYGTTSGFPSDTWNSTNYWVDVVFTTSTGPDTTAPTVTGRSPESGATGTASSTTVTATFSEAMGAATLTASTFTLTAGSGAVTAAVSYDTGTKTATLAPTQPLSDSTAYTATLKGGATGVKDLAGNPLAADVTWSFTTGTQLSACSAPANAVVAENCLAGSPPSEWDVTGSGDPSIQGFATAISVNRGETVSFKIDTNAAAYRLDIYRMGFYSGNGARKVDTVLPTVVLPQTQPSCLTNSTGLIDCGNWAVSADWTVPATAVSGIYFARLVREDTAGASHVVFVVRDDAGDSDILFQTSDTTWQAYNEYGGNSLYTGTGPGVGGGADGRAYKVSYNRPFTTRDVANGQDWVFNAEYPMVRWLEANGYDVSYFTGVDSDRRGALIQSHRVFLSVGHDEYWSGAQRMNVELARDAGVHLAFFSGNEVFWKTRWENSIDASGTPYRTLVCYKETHSYPSNRDPQDPPTWTGTWRDPRSSPPADGGRPENALTGTLFTVNDGATGSIQVPAEDGKLRFWRNTSVATLPTGQTATLPFGTLGYEWDEDIDNGSRPAGSIRLSTTTVTSAPVLLDYGSTFGSGTATHALTLSRHPSGALVFSAGTIQWSWGLDSNHDRGSTPADARMQQATANLFADMGAQPATLQSGLVAAAPSSDTAAPSSIMAAPASGASLTVGSLVTISGTATDAGGGRVGGVEVSVDGGSTWHPAAGRSNWSYTWTPSVPGTYSIRSRAADDSGNLQVPGADVTVTVVAQGATEGCSGESLWPLSATPSLVTAPDTAGTELGVKFRANANGFICGLRFYKGPQNTGTHLANLWSIGGQRLATAVFTGETATGWQQVDFAAPVPVTAGTLYIASYYAPSGHYSADTGYFLTTGVDAGALYAPQDGEQGSNGQYRYGVSGFPASSFEGSNYWVDVVFTAGGP